jgi:hypothetical protein
LHWHPNAAEWQYILSGSFEVTLFGSKGRWRQEILNQGDVGYIPHRPLMPDRSPTYVRLIAHATRDAIGGIADMNEQRSRWLNTIGSREPQPSKKI